MKRVILAITATLMLMSSGCNAPSDHDDTSTESDSASYSAFCYVANKNSGKLHSIFCDSLPYESNREYFETIEEAHSAGYTDHHKECMGN